jgi:hypothetical protein
MKRKRKTRQQIAKLFEKKCYFCKEDNYNLLDVHRILEGKDGGTYHPMNTIVTCVKCHRLIHTKEIKIDKKYQSTKGLMLHYYIGEQEYWELI